VRGGAAGLAFRAAALALLTALGLAGTVTAGQVCLAAGEIQRTAISRFFLGRISGEHEAEPKDRPRKQFYEHGTSLQQMSFGKSAMPAHMAQINSDRAAKKDALSRRAGAARGSAAPNALEKMRPRAFWKQRERRLPSQTRLRNDRDLGDRNRHSECRRLRPLNAFHRQSRVALTAALELRTRRHPDRIRPLDRLPMLAATSLATG
jgi:hypothetical protein